MARNPSMSGRYNGLGLFKFGPRGSDVIDRIDDSIGRYYATAQTTNGNFELAPRAQEKD